MSKKNDILQLRKEGKTYSEISELLNISKGTIAYHCNSTTKTKLFNKQTQRRKDLMLELKQLAGGKCHICAYNKCFRALEFHHKDPEVKESEIGRMLTTSSKARLLEEVNKCTLLCANCHREVHAGLLILTS